LHDNFGAEAQKVGLVHHESRTWDCVGCDTASSATL